MWKYLRFFSGKLDRNKNPRWGRKAAIVYAFGTWTLLGLFFAKWKSTNYGIPSLGEAMKDMTEEEKLELRRQNLAVQKKRSEETSLYVAENVYTPLDFMS